MVETDAESWSKFYAAPADRGETERFLHAIELTDGNDGSGRVVIDLGSGAGVEARAFLDRGWSVFALDTEPEAVDRLLALIDEVQRARLTAVVAAFDEVELPTADLVFAQYSLPFAIGDRFEPSVEAAVEAVKPGGWFYGHFFGPNDEWAGHGATASVRSDIERYFAGFDPLTIAEEEGMRDTLTVGPKYWHVFTVEARRPDT